MKMSELLEKVKEYSIKYYGVIKNELKDAKIECHYEKDGDSKVSIEKQGKQYTLKFDYNSK